MFADWVFLGFSTAVSVISKSSKAPGLFVGHIPTQRLGSVAVDAGSSVAGLIWHKWRWLNHTGSKGSEVFSHTKHRSSCSCRDLHGVPPPPQILILLTISTNVGKFSQSWGGWNKPPRSSCPHHSAAPKADLWSHQSLIPVSLFALK